MTPGGNAPMQREQLERLCGQFLEPTIEAGKDSALNPKNFTHYVYSPADQNYRFTLDLDKDGAKDTMPQYPYAAYNWGRPTVHSSGANVTLLDGHVERVTFKSLWQINAAGKVVHSFWYLED